jgi:HlyD family secretion protein
MADTSSRTETQTQLSPLPAGDLVPIHAAPPAMLPPPPRRRRWGLLLLLILAGIGGGGIWWWKHALPTLPAGITVSNGRLEADEIDIATKFAGRIAQILADEGDRISQGQMVARMDTRDLEASLAQADAQVAQARHAITQSQQELVQAGAQLKLAAQELDRARTLVRDHFETMQILDSRQATFDAATAAFRGAEAKIAAATAAMEAAIHSADVIHINIADASLVAPKAGPIQYRLANVGEVLAAGGKVFTMLDETDVYMDIFLPSQAAGKAKLGDEARIVLDAQPDRPIPATVSFIASQNQFTPKMVETKDERDKLMFRIRLRIDPNWLKAQAGSAQSGQPGLGYLRLDPKVAWPAALRAAAGS